MKPAPRRVQPWRRALPLVAALVVIVATALLGRWQLHRAQEKLALQAALEARLQAPAVDLNELDGRVRDVDGLRFRRAHAHGHYLPAGQIYIDNRDQDGVTGYHVLTPLALGHQVVLVNRGFLPRDLSANHPPAVAVPAGDVDVDGQLSLARSRFLELSADTINGAVWQNLKIDEYRARSGLDALPLVLLAAHSDSGLTPVHEQPDANVAMHQGYAFQWFSLCAATAALTLYFTFFRRSKAQS